MKKCELIIAEVWPLNPRNFANLVIGGAVTSLLALLLYEIVDYRARLTGLPEFIRFYLLPSAMIMLLLASFKLRDALRVNVALALVAIIISLYVGQAMLFLFPSVDIVDMNPQITAARANGITLPATSKLEMLEQLEAEGVESFPSIQPTFLLQGLDGFVINGVDVLPLAGISRVVTVYCGEGFQNENGRHIIYQSDEHGFHNPTGLHNAERLDIAVLGDSFTQGHCVDSDENIVALIRGKYPDTIGLGMSGNGPLLTFATLKEFAEPLKPAIVLWLYYEGNDLGDIEKEERTEALMAYLEDNQLQNLRTIQPEIDLKLREYVEAERIKYELRLRKEDKRPWLRFLLLEHLRGFLRSNLHRVTSETLTTAPDQELNLLRDVLSQANESVLSWGGKLYFVYLPERQRYDNALLASPYRNDVLQIASDLGMPIIDISERISRHDDPLSLFAFRMNPHYNADGYRLVAEEILSFIEAEGESK